MYTIRSITFNLDHEMDSFHIISNREDLIPWTLSVRIWTYVSRIKDEKPILRESQTQLPLTRNLAH
jgi:hypothetical protein